ncbi:MAG TPA: hypothetical protein PLL64_01555 [Rhodothermales bacterium]|nr:hypothetical protein [Rhodothermales bacterium]
MKKRFFLLLSLLCSLSTRVHSQSDTSIPLYYNGNINGKLQILMHLSLTEDVLSGTYVYTSQNKPIILRGSLYEDQFSASEYDAAGRITGTFKGQLDEFENIQGLWRSADGRKQYPFSIERIGSRNRLDTTHSHQFVIKNAAPQYEARFSVANCEGDTCTGLATIGLYDKSGRHIQTFFSDDLYMTLDENQKPSVNVVQLYNEQSALVFDDFNFDGQTDLAIRNGNMSGYGGPSYDVYLYHPAKNRFEFHIPLSLMVMENLGLFRTDVKRKVLVTFTKSGCCWHQTSENAWRNGQIVLIKKITEDATGANDRVLVTTEVLTGTKWKKSVKTYKIADYYKE